MKNAIVRKSPLAQLAMRVAVITSMAFVAFLFAACEMNELSGQTELSAQAGSKLLADARCYDPDTPVPTPTPTPSGFLGTASTFAVLGATTVTNTGATVLDGNAGVSPGTAMTGFLEAPGPVTFLSGEIHAGDAVAAQAQVDAHIAYLNLVAQPITADPFDPVQELAGLTLTPGVYSFPSSAFLNGILVLDFQGNNDAVFIFIIGSTLITGTDAQVIVQNGGQAGNVYWAVGSSATLGTGTQFVGNIVAVTSITITTGVSMSGSAIALGGAVTLDTNNISVSAGSGGGTVPPVVRCKDFVTGGGWIVGNYDGKGKKNDKATFGVSGGIKNGKFWGQLSYNDHGKDGVKVKGTGVTAYIVIDAVTRQIEGTAKVNGEGLFTYKVIVADNGERGRNDTFSLEVSNGSGVVYMAAGTLKGGNIQLHNTAWGAWRDIRRKSLDIDDEENYVDADQIAWSE